MIKGLKKLGILALSAVIAMGTVMAVLPAKEVWADDYKPLKPVVGSEQVIKDWDFHSGLYKEMDGVIVAVGDSNYNGLIGKRLKSDVGGSPGFGLNVKYGTGLIIKYLQAYKSYDNELFDVYLKITPGPINTFYNDEKELVEKEVEIFRDGSNGGGDIKKAGSTYFISFRTGAEGHEHKESGHESEPGAKGTDFEYEIWLRHNPKTGEEAASYTTYDKPAVDLDKEEMFVGGSTYMAGDANSSKSIEVARPWSSNGILYANDVTGSSGHYWKYLESYDYGGKNCWGWISTDENYTDQADKFVIGYGYTGDHSIKGGYTNNYANRTTKSGIAEILLGYRVRKLIFEVAPDDNGYSKEHAEMRVANDEYLEGSVVSRKTVKPYNDGTTYMPSDDTHFGGNFNPGYQFAYWTVGQDVDLVDGNGNVVRTIKEGERITEADMPFVRIEGDPEKPDLVFYAHTVNVPVKLNYYIQNEQLDNILSSHKPGPINTLSYSEIYQKDIQPTVNGSYKKEDNVVIKGKDGKNYKLVGWFNEPEFITEYGFGTTLDRDKNIYAKWVVVDPPKPDPDPDPDPDPSSDSGSTQTPATVAPAAPAPLPAGTVRVSPKTGDTTIPPIYYVMSAAALAGIGFLVFRRRGKN